MSDIESWRWVLEDLSKRLGEGTETLRYEHNAVRVVIERINDEVDCHCRQATQPGALQPMCDSVEEAILQECDFLCEQRKKFENLILVLEKQMAVLEKNKKNIESDILNKQEALNIEEGCAKITLQSPPTGEIKKKQKRKNTPVDRWERRCTSLKRGGLQALSNAVLTRQQVRGARVYLSIAAQSYAARVDSAIRRRLLTNKVKLQDLQWQKDEAVRDYKALTEELTATEQNLLETMEQERVVAARLADRSLRPVRELTRDEVDRKLRDEIGRLRKFIKQLTVNHERILILQNHLTSCITRIDDCVEDIMKVVQIDEDRILQRNGEVASLPNASNSNIKQDSSRKIEDVPLQAIMEENEEEIDDYPFDD